MGSINGNWVDFIGRTAATMGRGYGLKRANQFIMRMDSLWKGTSEY